MSKLMRCMQGEISSDGFLMVMAITVRGPCFDRAGIWVVFDHRKGVCKYDRTCCDFEAATRLLNSSVYWELAFKGFLFCGDQSVSDDEPWLAPCVLLGKFSIPRLYSLSPQSPRIPAFTHLFPCRMPLSRRLTDDYSSSSLSTGNEIGSHAEFMFDAAKDERGLLAYLRDHVREENDFNNNVYEPELELKGINVDDVFRKALVSLICHGEVSDDLIDNQIDWYTHGSNEHNTLQHLQSLRCINRPVRYPWLGIPRTSDILVISDRVHQQRLDILFIN